VKNISQIISDHYLCHMIQYETKTAAEAVQHFERNEYPDILPELKQGEKAEYDRVRKIINDARLGRVSDTRARALLQKYGGENYRVTTAFEVAISET
jgi:hypothetical protein